MSREFGASRHVAGVVGSQNRDKDLRLPSTISAERPQYQHATNEEDTDIDILPLRYTTHYRRRIRRCNGGQRTVRLLMDMPSLMQAPGSTEIVA